MKRFFVFILIFILLFIALFLFTGKIEECYARSGPDFSIQSWEEFNRENPYLFLEEVREVRLNGDWSVDESRHYRIKIQKDSARELGEQKIQYNKSREEIIDIQAHVEVPNGESYLYTEIQDLAVYEGAPLYSDSRVKIITLPQVNVGSIIDVKVKAKIKHNVIRNQFSYQELYPPQPHKHYKATYIIPEKMDVQFKQFKAIAPPKREEKDDKVIYTFEYHETVALGENMLYLPPYVEIFGISSFSSMEGWQVIADWYRDLVRKNTIENEAITKKARELTDGKTTEKEKVRAIMEFLQDNMRYVSMSFGDNTVEPHPTDEIFSNRYGDCKDWGTLARQMLGRIGIQADICLFNDELAGDPQWGLPSVSAFDHLILKVKADGKSYFMDPQLKNFDFGQFPSEYNNASLLVIEDEDYQFEKIPVQSQKNTENHIKVVINVNEKGGATYKVKAKPGIEESNFLRIIWDDLPVNRKDDIFDMIETQFAKGGEFLNPAMKGIKNRYGPLLLTFTIKSPYAYQVVNNMMILKEQVNQYFPNPFMRKKRSYPVFVPHNETTHIWGIYNIPGQFKVNFIPEDFYLKNNILALSRKMKYKEGRLYVHYGFHFKRGRLPAERYSEIQELWKEFYEKSRDSVVLERRK